MPSIDCDLDWDRIDRGIGDRLRTLDSFNMLHIVRAQNLHLARLYDPFFAC